MMNKTKSAFSVLLLSGIMFGASCSKDSNPVTPPSLNGKKVKLTFSVSGNVEDNDYISFVASGGTYNNDKTVWKINGVEKANENAVGLDEDDFTGSTKTYVIESIMPLTAASIGIQCINFGESYTVSYKAEIDGKIENNDQNIIVTVDNDYSHNFNY